jgi:glycosyltransferase involved in cell wall biosynthesis
MRILHVLHSLDQRYGGPLRAVLDLSARSATSDFDAELLGFGDISIPDNPLRADKIHALPISFPRRYGYSPELQKWIDSNLERFDGVILHGMWVYPNWLFSKACRRAHIPYVCFPHGMLEPWAMYAQGKIKAVKKTLYWLLREREIFRHAAAVFFTTQRERELSGKVFRTASSTFVVVPYGVAAMEETAAHPARPELNFPPNCKVALFLGRVHPVKNIDFLIEAWIEANPDSHWLLIVAGPSEPAYQRTLASLSARCKVPNQVRFVGAVYGQDKSYLLGRASWLLHPSQHENFGISVLEAVNAGCPVAISDQVYLADEFHEKSEVLPIRLDAWIEFLRDRMPDEEYQRTIVQLDRKYLVPKFSIECVTRNWTSTITNVFAQAVKTGGK